MNPFRIRSTEVFSESDLIAFYFGELSARRRGTLVSALERTPALAAESAAIAADLRRLTPPHLQVDQSVLDRNWQAIESSLVPHNGSRPPAVPFRLPLLLVGCAAVAIAIAFFLLNSTHRSEPTNEASSAANVRSRPAISTINNTSGDRIIPGRHTYPLSTAPSRKPDLASAEIRLEQPAPNPSVHFLSLAAVPGTPAFFVNPFALKPEPLSLSPLPPTPVVSLKPRPLAGGKRSRPRTADLMLAMGGNFIASHSSLTGGNEPRTETVTPAIAALAAFHQQFRPALGYRITASYFRPDFTYTYAAGTTFNNAGEINSRIYELAATYVVQGPHHRRLSTSADAGGALLAFLPTQPNMPDSYVFRGAAALGANVDLAISKHWGARIAYRAQVYKGPDFRYSGTTIPVTSSYTVSSEPSLGITYRFGKQ